MNSMMMKTALALVIIGGLNWGLVGLLNFDLVAFIFGSAQSFLARAVYIVIAACAIACVPAMFRSEDTAVR